MAWGDNTWHKVQDLLSKEFGVDNDIYKGVSKDIHNLFLADGWTPPPENYERAVETMPDMSAAFQRAINDVVASSPPDTHTMEEIDSMKTPEADSCPTCAEGQAPPEPVVEKHPLPQMKACKCGHMLKAHFGAGCLACSTCSVYEEEV